MMLSEVVCNLGVLFDQKLTRACYLHLRDIRQVKKCPNDQRLRVLVMSQLDFRNSVLVGLPKVIVLYVAAHLINDIRPCDHITPSLQQLHRLQIKARITFKIDSLHGQYLLRLCTSLNVLSGNTGYVYPVKAEPAISYTRDFNQVRSHLQFKKVFFLWVVDFPVQVSLHNACPQYLTSLHSIAPASLCLLINLLSQPHIHIARTSHGFWHAGPFLWNSLPAHEIWLQIKTKNSVILTLTICALLDQHNSCCFFGEIILHYRNLILLLLLILLPYIIA